MDICGGKMKKILICLVSLVLVLNVIFAVELTDYSKYAEKGVISPTDTETQVGKVIGKNFNAEDVTVKGVEINKEKEFSTFVFREENSKVCIKENCFENIQSKPDGPPSTIKLDKNGDILIADFKTNKKGGVYTVGGSTFEAPPNSRVYYNKERGYPPNVKLEKNSKMSVLPGSEKYSTLQGEVSYEGENFKIGNDEIKRLKGNLGKISVSDGKIIKVWEDTEAIVNKIEHKTLKNSLSLYYDENFDASSHLEENYFNYGKNKIWLGGEGFTSILKEDNNIFPSMKSSGKGDIQLSPIGGQIELTENSKENRFDIKSKDDFMLTTKGLKLSKSQDSLKIFTPIESKSGTGYDFNIDEKYSFKEGVLSSIQNPNLKVNTNDLAHSTVTKTKNLNQDALNKVKQNAQAKFGVRPKNYLGYVNSVEEKDFAQWVYDATERANQNNKGVKVTPAEIYSAAMSEGAILWMNKHYYPNTYDKSGKPTYNPNAPVDGFVYLGTDVIGAPSEMRRLVAGGFVDPDVATYKTTYKNEKGETVQSAIFQDMPTGLKAFAGVYAERKSLFETDFKNNFGEAKFNQLSDDEKYFWTTVYYNAGMGAGKDFLTGKRGPGREEYYTAWKGKEPTTNTNARYNALWRTSTYASIKNSCVFAGSC